MAPMPTTRKGLKEAGYKHYSNSTCRGCGVPIEFWQTPAGNSMPIHRTLVEGCETLVCHFVDCDTRAQFRKANRIGKPKKPTTGSLFE